MPKAGLLIKTSDSVFEQLSESHNLRNGSSNSSQLDESELLLGLEQVVDVSEGSAESCVLAQSDLFFRFILFANIY